MAVNEFKPHFREGDVIFNEGDPGDSFYVVDEGSVELKKKADGVMVTLATIGNGVIFGEMALLDGRRRMATAVAAEDTRCRRFLAEHLEKRLDALQPGMRKVFDEMLKFVRETLPWDVRMARPGLAGEMERDARTRPMPRAPSATLPGELTDPVLDAVYNLLKHYAQRRLPEQPPS